MARNIAFLPPLRDEGLPELPQPGCWEAEQPDLLRRLANALRTQHREPDTLAIASVPDLWAQPLSFLAAWRDQSHPGFPRARAEWRGLLALLAFNDYLGLGLRLVCLDLNRLGREPWSHAVEEAADPVNLMQILAAHRPRVGLSRRRPWDEFGLIVAGEGPVGLVAGPTLVCPSRSYLAHLPAGIYWRDERGGHLADPCAFQHMSVGEARALRIYLEHVRENLTTLFGQGRLGRLDMELVGAIEEALRSYHHCAQETERRLGGGSRHAGAFRLHHANGDFASLAYGFLGSSVLPRHDAVGDAVLPVRREFEGALKGAVLFDADIPRQLNLRPQDLQVWDQYSHAQIGRWPNLVPDIERRVEESGYLAIRGQDLLSDVFVEIDGPASAGGEYPHNYLMPLRPLALLFLDPKSLGKAVRVYWDQSGVEVELDVELQIAGHRRTYTITKTYAAGRMRRAARPTVLVTWPDFASEHWKHYYVFFASDVGRLVPYGLISPRLIREKTAGAATGAAAVRAVRALNRATAASEGARKKKFPLAVGEIGALWTDHPPEALLCGIAGDTDAEPAAGILPLPEARRVHASAGRWQIGVDLGTTNTSIYWSKITNQGRTNNPMAFKRRTIAPLGKIDLTALVMRDYFLPDDVDIEIPFLSILEAHDSAAEPMLPFFGKRVHYVSDVAIALNRLAGRDGGPQMHFDFKWSKDPDSHLKVASYLSQVCLQSLAEVVSMGADPDRVEWYFSRPGVFSAERMDDFQESYARAVQVAFGTDRRAAPPAPTVMLESESAALYFLERETIPLGRVVLTLDVGGQTTDICLWQARSLKWQGSQRLAGQHILIPYLAAHQEAVSRITARTNALKGTPNQLAALDDQQVLKRGLEIVVNSDEFRASFQELMRSQVDDSALAGLRLTAEFALAGLVYYLGIVARHLYEAGRLEAPLDDMRVCLGGRGSLAFRPIAGDAVASRYATIFKKAAGLEIGELTFHYSSNPKHEVAYGLLVPRRGATDLNLKDSCPAVILGERLLIGNRPTEYYESLQTGDEDEVWHLQGLPCFEDFLKSYCQIFRRVLPKSVRLRDVADKMDGEVVDLRARIKDDRRRRGSDLDGSGSIFICALRAYLEIMNARAETIAME